MNINLSDKATKNLASVIGSEEPEQLAIFLERVSGNEQFLRVALLASPTDQELTASVGMINSSLEDIEDGRVKPFSSAMGSIAQRAKFNLKK